MNFSMSKFPILLTVLGVVAAGTILLTSAPAPVFTPNQKAFYLDEQQANFIRPGLIHKILGVEIAADGTVKARIKMTDPRGVPLDREGITTPGTIAASFILATIPKGQAQYTSYTTRVQTSPITGARAVQAAGDTGGSWAKVADGEYIYTFGTKLPANADRTATHTVGVYGSRNLSEFNLPTNYDDDVYNFVPAGGPVTVVRDLIRTPTCNACHQDLGIHGGSRKTMELCNLCHTPQTIDPDTGNTVDMPVMTHKIHMGANLPSVKAGKPYVIIGNQQSVHDYSHIVFTADARNCQQCHEPGPTQAAKALIPNRAACGACHDDVNFATGANHANIVVNDDARCAACHQPQGEKEFDISVVGAHQIPRFSKQLPGVVFTIANVYNTKPGDQPTVEFTLKDKSGKPILPSQMSRLTIILAGPNTDYGTYVSETATRAEGTADGRYWWTMTARIPANAKGSWTIGLEGRRDVQIVGPGAAPLAVRDTGVNQQYYFTVDGTPVQPRRLVADIKKCNVCHEALAFHGEARNTVQECVICHNPTMTGSPEPRRSIEMSVMTHKIHMGANLTRGYTIAGHVYDKIGYPGRLNRCDGCHINNSHRLPLSPGKLDVVSPWDLISPAGRETAACLSCHDSSAAASHAKANTSSLGESCSVCHGTNSEFSVDRVHAQ